MHRSIARPLTVVLTVVALSMTLLQVGAANAAEEVVVVIDPAAATADPAGPGTAERPAATIEQGLDLAVDHINDGTDTRVVIREGLYRESVVPKAWGQRTAARLTIEGEGDVVITGTDRFTGWTAVPGTPDTFTVAWPHAWGATAIPDHWPSDMAEIVRRRELVMLDGTGLRQVLSPAELATTPGSYHVAEATGLLTVRFPAGAAADPTRLEVAVRSTLLEVDGWTGVTVRNLTVVGAATETQQYAARIIHSQDVLVEDVDVSWSSFGGLAIMRSEDITLRRVTTNSNGISGMDGWRVSNLLVEDSEASRNNWRGDWGGWHGWHVGSKFMSTRGATFRRVRMVDNLGHGLWFDTDNTDIVIEDSMIGRNLRHGLFLEANQGPISVQNTLVCNNSDAGVLDGKSDNTVLQGNTIFGNASGQILHAGSAGGRTFNIYDAETRHTARSTGWRVEDNVVVGTDAGQFTSTTSLSQDEWNLVMGTMTSRGNRWFAADPAAAFRVPNGRATDLAGWQSSTGQDGNSAFTAPTEPLDCGDSASAFTQPTTPAQELAAPGVYRRG